MVAVGCRSAGGGGGPKSRRLGLVRTLAMDCFNVGCSAMGSWSKWEPMLLKHAI